MPAQAITGLPRAPRGDDAIAFDRARAILRREGEMTITEFHELDALFHALGQVQFRTLTDDPLHQIRLRRYEALSWRLCRPAALVAFMLIGIGSAAGTILALLVR